MQLETIKVSIKNFDELKDILSQQQAYLENSFQVTRIGVFGSYARNQQTDNSDIDILIDLKKPIGFVLFLQLENYLSDLLGKKVDLVTRKALKSIIGKEILAEVRYV
jgi:uncharacterized protein